MKNYDITKGTIFVVSRKNYKDESDTDLGLRGDVNEDYEDVTDIEIGDNGVTFITYSESFVFLPMSSINSIYFKEMPKVIK